MKKSIRVILFIFIFSIVYSNFIAIKDIYATTPSNEECIAEANKYIEKVYGLSPNYYSSSNAKGSLRVVRYSGGGVFLVYGTTSNARAIGYTKSGQLFPNPEYPTEIFYSGNTRWYTPAEIISKNKQGTGPGTKWYTSSSVFQNVYKVKREDLKDLHPELDRRKDLDLSKIFYVVAPPTEYTWGLVVAYHQVGSTIAYTTALVEPYSLQSQNIRVDGQFPASSSAGSTIDLRFNINSTFNSGDNAVSYEFYAKNSSGGYISRETGTFNFSSQKNVEFKTTFTMPESGRVEIYLEVNKGGTATSPKETALEDNKVQGYVNQIASVAVSGGDFTIDYNVLRKYVSFPLVSGGISGTLTKPQGSWVGNAKGTLVISNKSSSLLRTLCHPGCGCGCNINDCVCSRSCWNYFVSESSAGYTISDDTPAIDSYTDSISIGNSTLRANPQIHASMRRSYFGDTPDAASESARVYKPNANQSASGTISAAWKSQFNRDYRYWVTTEYGGYWVYSTAYLGMPTLNVTKNVLCKIYNGISNSELNIRTFDATKEGDNKESFIKKLKWQSTPLDLKVVRFMYYDSGSGDPSPSNLTNMTAVNGKYIRQFIEQNDADWEWRVRNSLEGSYREDRRKAENREYKTDRDIDRDQEAKAVFASDMDDRIQSKAYPIRSGYFFNPAGTYTFEVTTNLYKKTNTLTQEHKDLVNELIDSFRYESDMVYQDIDGSAVYLNGDSAEKGRTAYERRRTAIGVGDNELPGTKIEYNKEATNLAAYELNHSYPTDGQDKAYATPPNVMDNRFKEVLEGYNKFGTTSGTEPGSSYSRRQYKYTEYVHKDEKMYKITETTKVTITINRDNTRLYTHPQMEDTSYRNGGYEDSDNYSIRVYCAPINLDRLNSEQLRGLAGTISGIEFLDGKIDITVVGSIYDDQR